ncbi:RsiV family protein [[Clostridium] colinum]|uniref:RsiV family protein n=1 Tax=[Clostridium] colinum TaxID=36835 RepID=UPI0020245C0F|nr:RsiV family protein [[Clostridium] colinum]
MEDRDIIEKLKKEYDNINVKEEGVFLMKKSIEQAKKENEKNKLKYLSIASVAVIAIFVALPNLNQNIALAMSKIPVIGKIVDVITINKYSEEDKNISVEAPVATDANNNKSLDELNKSTDEYIKNLTEEFKKEFKQGDNKSLDITYDTLTDDEKLFSLRIKGTEINASGYMYSKIYNVDKEKGNIIELKDIFKADSNYVEVLSQNIKEQMREQMKQDTNKSYFIDSDMPENDFKQIKENQNFYFNKDKNLVLCFDEYEVAPGSMGTVEFVIPQDITKDILK